MSCYCNSLNTGLPCCCPTYTTTTTTIAPCEDAIVCDALYSTDCVIYDGDQVVFENCLTINPGDTYTTILEGIMSNLSLCTTTIPVVDITFSFYGDQIGTFPSIFEMGRTDDGYVNITVNWGDGNSDTYTGSGLQIMSHNYASTDNYTITINLTDISNYYYLHLTNTVVSLFTGIDSNPLSIVEIISCSLNTDEVDHILHQLATSPYLIPYGSVALFNNTPPAPPSPSGWDSITILDSIGWPVSVD